MSYIAEFAERKLQPIKNKIFLLIGRGILSLVNNAQKTQKLQIKGLATEINSDGERLQEYGFETYPYADGDTETLTLYINGRRERGITIVCHNRELRPTDLLEGETCHWAKDSLGGNANRITIKPTDEIEIKTKDDQSIVLTPTSITITDSINGNTITMDSTNIEMKRGLNSVAISETNVLINGTNLEVIP